MIILGLDMESVLFWRNIFFCFYLCACRFIKRFLFSCPISFDGGIKKIKELKLNMSQLDSDKYYKEKLG